MRFSKMVLPGLTITLLVFGAAIFSQFAPETYGQPEIEIVDPGSTGQRVEEAGLFGNYYPANESAGEPNQHPGVLLLGGSEGGLGSGAKQMALSLQAEGFSVLQLAYFGGPDQPKSLERIPLEIFDQGLEWLKRQATIDPEKLSVVGVSKGAEAALFVGSRRPDLRAVVAGTPSSVAWNGINWANRGQSPHASWTVGGRDVPTMPFSDYNRADGIISVYRSVEDPAHRAHLEKAAIPIEEANAEILLVCGEAETMWPACPMSRMIAARREARSGGPVTMLSYPDAGHFVFGPPLTPEHPFYKRLDVFGGSIEGNAAARADSWPKVIAFLKQAAANP